MYPILDPIFNELSRLNKVIVIDGKEYAYIVKEKRIYNTFRTRLTRGIDYQIETSDSIGFIEFNRTSVDIFAGTASNSLLNFLNAHDALVWCTRELLKQAS